MGTKCKVCGGTDVSLVDGFYYCVECGTQDVEARETVVEQTVLADGTFAHVTIKKLTTVLQDSLEMSGEWMKWHAYNFILAGLTEELIAVGAKPKIKIMVLWIWTKYIKKFQDKEALINKTHLQNESLYVTKTSQKVLEAHSTDTDNSSDVYCKKKSRKTKKKNSDKFRRDIKIVTKGTLLTILYIALNLDKSEIQLSHLFRFIKEGRLSLFNCTKFVPKEIDVKSIPHWKNFSLCRNDYTPKVIRAFAMTFFKRLDLGVPLVPDLNKIVSNFTKELCLPNDFKQLVLSLMFFMPCDFLKLDFKSKRNLVRIPDYEGVCMCYILIALKMCFGLDCDYEIRLSEEVDRINAKENHSKSHKLGFYSDSTNRLFSFHEWYQYLQFRKTILCKNYLPMSRIYNLQVDDCVLMEQLEERSSRKMKLSDDVTMDIINKITVDDEICVIPKNKFPSTLTPITTYTDVVLQYIQDPELKLLLCEDFSKYSLKYVVEDLYLPDSNEFSLNLIEGVSTENKTLNPFVVGTLVTKKGDNTMVFVRNCENKNWLKTKPPTLEHIKKVSDKESDHGYDSNIECTPTKSDETEGTENEDTPEEKILKIIEEEDEGVNIFDDDFTDFCDSLLMVEDKSASKIEHDESGDDREFSNFFDTKLEVHDSFDDASNAIESQVVFDPETFDREKTIKELIEIACKQYKIPFRKDVNRRERAQYKRKQPQDIVQTDIKKRKIDKEGFKDSKRVAQALVAAYYESIENDCLYNVIESVNSAIRKANEDNDTNANENISNISAKDETQNESIPQNFENTQNVAGDESILYAGNNASVISSIYPENTLNDINLDEDTLDESIVLPNPNFDAETHDIKQLYIKLNDGRELDDSVTLDDDVELDKIIAKKIEEYANKDNLFKCIVNKDDLSDSDDDIPLSELANMKKIYMGKGPTVDKLTLDCLVRNKKVEKFNYWIRHYKSPAVKRSVDMTQKFDIELTENCPKSFVFVIRECAAVLNCTTFCLYKCMQCLEETMLGLC